MFLRRNNICLNENLRLHPLETTFLLLKVSLCFFFESWLKYQLKYKVSIDSWEEKDWLLFSMNVLVTDYKEQEV